MFELLRLVACLKETKVLRNAIFPIVLIGFLGAGCTSMSGVNQTSAPSTDAAEIGEFEYGPYVLMKGYLEKEQYLDDLALLPAPPQPGTAQQKGDDEAFHELTALQGGPRGDMARADAVLNFPQAAETFACAVGVQISEGSTPHLYTLLRRSETDAGLASSISKKHYKRLRPFEVFETQTCLPEDDEFLRGNASYPSGHTTIGWTWALILAEVAPDRADQILQRGRAFGQSRAICGAHWKSDVDAGFMLGAGVASILHTDPVFNQQVVAAKEEVERVRAAGLVPQADQCQAEAKTIEAAAQAAP